MHAPLGHAYGHPFGVPIIGRDFFYFVAPVMHPYGVHMGTPTGYPLMGALKGTHMCTLWVHIYVTIMGHPMGAPYGYPVGVPIIILFRGSHVHSPSARSRLL